MTSRSLRRHGGGLGFLAVLFLVAWSIRIHPVDAAQFTVVDQIITINASASGFYFWNNTDKGPTNWLSPDNFKTGQFYFRYEVLEQPTNTPFYLSFCIWDDGNKETASNLSAALTGPGSVSIFNSSPSSWWSQNGGVDFSDPYNFIRWGLPIWASKDPIIPLAPKYYSDDPRSWEIYWPHNQDWFPMKLRATIVAVSQGSTFTGFPVPEPSTFALLASGLMGAFAYAWRKRK